MSSYRGSDIEAGRRGRCYFVSLREQAVSTVFRGVKMFWKDEGSNNLQVLEIVVYVLHAVGRHC